MAFVTVQVFEHQTIRVGQPVRTTSGAATAITERHHRALADFAEANKNRYFVCGRRTVHFGSYVGLLQLGELVIEILPKTDRNDRDHGRWHRALIHMLRVAGELGLELHDEANLTVEPGRLFDLFISHFLDETERLLHEGLVKSYRTEEANRTTFAGSLLVAQHVRRNAVNAARFYVSSPVYDHRHRMNLALHEALRVVENLPVESGTRSRARSLRYACPDLPRWIPDRAALDAHRWTRNTLRYERAVRLARLILFDLAPHVRSGETPLLALLFNIESLWERYVAALAKRLDREKLDVRTQEQRAFWRSPRGVRPLRPDVTIRDRQTGEVRLVIDTKWKIPSDGHAASEDLKQMFCYHEVFDCSRSMLLYPSTSERSHLGDRGEYIDREHQCTMGFFAIGRHEDIERLLEMALTVIPANAAKTHHSRECSESGDPNVERVASPSLSLSRE